MKVPTKTEMREAISGAKEFWRNLSPEEQEIMLLNLSYFSKDENIGELIKIIGKDPA
jgi:hypothetical protein